MKKKKNNIKRYIKEIIKYNPFRSFVSFIIMCVLMLATLYQPQIIKRIIDDALQNNDIKLLVLLAIVYVFISMFYSIGELYLNYICNSISLGVSVRIRNRLIKHFIKLDGDFFTNKKNGELVKILDGDIGVIEEFGISTLFQIVIEVITACVSFIVLFQMQPMLLVIVVVVEICTIILQLYYTKKISLRTKEIRNIDGNIISQAEEIVANIMSIVINKMGKELLKKFIKNEKILIQKGIKRGLLIDFSGGISNILNASVKAMVYIIGGMWVINKHMTLGELIIYTQYVSMLIGPCICLIHINSQIQQTVIALDKIYEFEDYTVHVKQNNTGLCLNKESDIVIEFKNVGFSYNNNERVLENLNMILYTGKIFAIVGSSGSGKSTLPKLLLRLWEISEGTISINNKKISEYNLFNLRKNITYVTQDVFLYDATIWDNIVLGKEVNLKKVKQLCEELGINDFVKKFDEKYDTLVGEGGVKLSGGQKQRIAIARALLCNSPIMLFDEATSALDNVSQKKVVTIIKKCCREKILLIIAHRLSTVKDADCIYVMDKGKEVGKGTHMDLIKHNRYYQELNNGTIHIA